MVSRAFVAATGAALALWLAYCLSGVASRLLRIARHRPETAADAVRFGLLGAAKVAPHGLLYPAAMIESATVVAVGARDPSRARRLASKWGIPRSGDYASVLSDPVVEAVYIPLLNGLHYEWAAAALRAGKHVLCEKPLTSNAAEARVLSRLARERGLVLFEAFHYKCVEHTRYAPPLTLALSLALVPARTLALASHPLLHLCPRCNQVPPTSGTRAVAGGRRDGAGSCARAPGELQLPAVLTSPRPPHILRPPPTSAQVITHPLQLTSSRHKHFDAHPSDPLTHPSTHIL